jgi:hypothetical protein
MMKFASSPPNGTASKKDPTTGSSLPHKYGGSFSSKNTSPLNSVTPETATGATAKRPNVVETLNSADDYEAYTKERAQRKVPLPAGRGGRSAASDAKSSPGNSAPDYAAAVMSGGGGGYTSPTEDNVGELRGVVDAKFDARRAQKEPPVRNVNNSNTDQALAGPKAPPSTPENASASDVGSSVSNIKGSGQGSGQGSGKGSGSGSLSGKNRDTPQDRKRSGQTATLESVVGRKSGKK